MLKNNLIVAYRNLMKRKAFSLINILGLVIGISSSALIGLYVQNELSYDHFFNDSDQLYKMVVDRSGLEAKVSYSYVNIVPREYPEVEMATAIAGPYHRYSFYVKGENEENLHFLENDVVFADSSFFDVFSFELLIGDKKEVLRLANSIVLTKSMAKRLFGDTNPLGRTIKSSRSSLLVTGVCEDPPMNSHFKFSAVISSQSLGWFRSTEFSLATTHCYFKLNKGVSVEVLEQKIPNLVKIYAAGAIKDLYGITLEELFESGKGFSYSFIPVTSLHLHSANLGGFKVGGNRLTVNILIATALLIFLMTTINFINLWSARSLERAKEVGIRKVLGSQKNQLVYQFLSESFIISVVSTSLAVVVVIVFLPFFNNLTEENLTLQWNKSAFIYLSLSVLVVGLLAGIYPSFVLSSFKTISVLKGNFSQHGGKSVSNGFLVFQFWVSIVLIVSTLVVKKQIHFLTEKDLGFDQEKLLIIEGDVDEENGIAKQLLNELNAFPEIKAVAESNWVQGLESKLETYGYRRNESDEIFTSPRVVVGDQFAEVMGFKLLEGQFFSEDMDDSRAVIINEAAARFLGLESPVGKKVAQVTLRGDVYFTIKGVVADFHYRSLHEEIKPLIIRSTDNFKKMNFVVAKLSDGWTNRSIREIQAKWNELVPDYAFNYRFQDQVLDDQYNNERKMSKILILFSGLTLFVSLIGLLGLTAYNISLRTKEIGVRKVMGASVWDILIMISRYFIKVLLLAFLLAIPVSWYVMQSWLENFVFRIDIPLAAFGIACISVMIITCTVVSIQSINVAMMNPTKSIGSD